jgi:hypothetical protein
MVCMNLQIMYDLAIVYRLVCKYNEEILNKLKV